MKKPPSIKVFLLSLALLAAPTMFAANIVGYANVPVFVGDNLISNPFDNNWHNDLNSILLGPVAAGATFTKWDSAGNQFLPLSIFNGTSWSIDYTLNYGDGGLLHSATMWTNTFVGSVYPATWLGGNLVWQPNYADGLHLISSAVPISGNMDVMFTNVIGRLPHEGEWVQVLDASSQTYATTTYHTNGGWDNLSIQMNIGQAAWFDLGPAAVPEPATAGLVVAGVIIWAATRAKRPK
jgi:hypothetical protein